MANLHPLAKVPRDVGQRMIVKVICPHAHCGAKRRGLVDPSDLRDDLFLLPVPDIEVGTVGDPFIYPLIVTGMCTAMRRGDCCTLLRSSVDLEGGLLTRLPKEVNVTPSQPVLLKGAFAA